MKDLLNSLWKPASQIDKPEELIGKQCRHNVTKEPILLYKTDKYGLGIRYNDGSYTLLNTIIHGIEYLDDSPEAIESLTKEVFRNGYDTGYHDGVKSQRPDEQF